MPARRRGQESKRAQHRAMKGLPGARADRVVYDEMAEFDRGWEEHQADEAYRRSPVPLDALVRQEEQRERIRNDVRRALAAVEADFARWRRGDFS